jgi:2'-hydroxyisoflavone reductase
MDVLVIGGSVFLGRAVVDEALAAGARVTVFNRGLSGPVPDGVEHVVGDRTSKEDLQQLAGRAFDVVVDTCGYVPAEVAMSADLLAGSCGHYTFVSTINAFPGWPEVEDYHARGVHDGDPDASRDDVPEGTESYGWLKVGCELAVRRAFGDDRSAILRGGCIVGPHDSVVGRLPWWIARVAGGGEVLAPGRPHDPIALIDARDLATFALARVPGVFEVAGPPHRDTRADLLRACATASGADAQFVYVQDDWLAAKDVESWTEIPLWAPRAEMPSVFAHDTSAAEAAGLRWRPLAETVADTWAWMQALPQPWQPAPRTPGLDPAKERQLLADWRAR